MTIASYEDKKLCYGDKAYDFTPYWPLASDRRAWLQLGKTHLGEVAAGGEEAVFLYFGHEPQAAPAPLSMVWDQIQLQGALRMDFLKKGDMPVVDASLMSPFSVPKGRRIDEV